MRVEQGEYYDSSDEEKDEDGEIVGPHRNDFGHIGPDKADYDFEYCTILAKTARKKGGRNSEITHGLPSFFLKRYSQYSTLRH